MPPINDGELLQYNHHGIIPGPSEDEESYVIRADYCLQLRTQWTNNQENPFPYTEDDGSAITLLQEAFAITQPLYDITPTWLPVAFSNYRLAPWHGGCAWIFQNDENTPPGAFLQLRQGFRKKKKYLGLYNRDELIAHELAHVGRMTFEEKKFEEVLAYRSSRQTWRRWLGPIIQSPWESMLFMLTLLLLLMFDIYLIFTGQEETFRLMQWAKIFPVALIIVGLFRVWRNQKILEGCLRNLKPLTSSPGAVAFRLTDSEITQFSSASANQIRQYAHDQSEISIRWRLITLAYLQ